MKITIIDGTKARLTPTGGKIRDTLSGRLYSEMYVRVIDVWRYEDADSVEYEEITTDTIPEEVLQAFDQVVALILTTANNHNAIEDLKTLPVINIASLFGLAKAKGVTDAELQEIVLNVVMLKTDIEAKFQRSWYDIWNGNLKPYILEHIAATASAIQQ